MIVDFEVALINRIKAVLNVANLDAKVESYPNDPAGYNVASFTATILVRYGGKVFQTPPNRQFVMQHFTIEFDVFVLFRSLKGAGEGYELLQTLTNGLIGYDIAKDMRLFQFSEEIISERSDEIGFWIYQQRYGAEGVHRVY